MATASFCSIVSVFKSPALILASSVVRSIVEEFLLFGLTRRYKRIAPATINNQKIICLAVELKVFKASVADDTLNGPVLSRRLHTQFVLRKRPRHSNFNTGLGCRCDGSGCAEIASYLALVL